MFNVSFKFLWISFIVAAVFYINPARAQQVIPITTVYQVPGFGMAYTDVGYDRPGSGAYIQYGNQGFIKSITLDADPSFNILMSYFNDYGSALDCMAGGSGGYFGTICELILRPCVTFAGNYSAKVTIVRDVPYPFETYEYTDIYIVSFQSFVDTDPYPAPTRTCGETTTQPPSLVPVNSQNSCSIRNASSINMDSLALQENIPLVGIPFSMNYSSDRFRSGVNFAPKSLGLGGWTPNIFHHYDSTNSILYTGDNGIRNIQAVATSTGFYATDIAGTEIYYFDSNGVHQQTKDALTGVVKYTFSYDSSGRLISVADQFGNATTAQYNQNSVVLTSPYGQQTVLTYDSNGFLASVTNPNNEIYNLTSDSKGNLLTYQKPMGQTSTHTYDSNGYLTKDQGAGGNFIALVRQFDTSSQVQTVTSSTAMNRTTVYQTSATPSSSSHTVTAPNGSIGQSTSKDQVSDGATDAYGNISQSTPAKDPRFGWLAPYNANSTYTVPNSNVTSSVQVNKTATLANSSDPLSLTSLTSTATLQNDSSRVFTSSYSASNHLITMKSPLSRVVYETLNANGLPSQIQAGRLTPVSFGYDNRGRLSSVVQSNRQMTLAYDVHGNVASSKDVLGQITSFKYDNANRVIQENLPNGTVISMTYDSNGNLTSLRPPGKPAHQFSYNLFELVQSYLPPALSAQLSGATNYSYNLDRQLTQVSRPDGAQVDFNYDTTTGLLDSITTPSGNYTLTYNAKSDLVKNLTSPDGETLSYQYAGNLLTSVNSSGSISSSMNYSYNSDGSLASMTIAGSVAENIFYDKDGLTTKVGDLALTRNNVGSISDSTLGKVSEAVGFDHFGQISSEKFTSAKRILFTENFSRDKLGRITEIDQTKGFDDGRIGYDYDSAGRLTQVLRNGFPIRSYKYDSNGNRIEVFGEDSHIKAEYNAQDQLTKYGNAEYTYNANGDLIQKIENRKSWFDFWSKHKNKQKKTAYNYDVFGNLKSVTLPDGKLIEYIVDGQNRRVGKKINGKLVQGFIYQSQTQVAAELDGSGKIVKQFIYGSKTNIPDYMIMNGKEYRIISDQVGTPKLIVDSAKGQVVARMKFDEFGIPSGHFDDDDYDHERHGDHDAHDLSLPFSFAGGLYDHDTGLVRFGARDYDPVVGRWTARDPLLFGGGDSSLYAYCGNDPINCIDPSGLSQEEVDSALNWIRQNRSDLLTGLPKGLVVSDGHIPISAVGIVLPNAIIIDTSRHTTQDPDIRQATIIATLAHELMHAQDGFWTTFLGLGRGHDVIEPAEVKIGIEYLNSLQSKGSHPQCL